MDKAIAAREILLLGAFQEARAAALAEGIEIIPLKGAALLELGIYQPGERGMADADLLLRPKDLPGFEALLGRLGYQPMPNSADAWLKPSPNSAPPAILDLKKSRFFAELIGHTGPAYRPLAHKEHRGTL